MSFDSVFGKEQIQSLNEKMLTLDECLIPAVDV